MKRYRLLLILLSVVCVMSACELKAEQRIPTDGVWYCEELQAQFFVDNPGYVPVDYVPVHNENENYVTVDGDRIACAWGNLPGSMEIYVICQEDNPKYDLGQRIYTFEFVSLSDTEYLLKDKKTGSEYCFIRIGDVPTEN